jgi:thioredoxin-like negative regulator of GroEL
MRRLALAVGLLVLAGLAPAWAAPGLAEARDAAQRRDFATALPLFRQLLDQAPGDADLLVEAARVHGFADRNAEAAAHYRQAIAVAPRRRDGLLASLAWQTLWGGDPRAALLLFDELAADPTRRADALDGQGQAHMALDAPAAAVTAFRAALALQPQSPALQRRLARALLWADQPEAAAAELQALMARQPGDREAAWALADALNSAGLHRQALRTFATQPPPVTPAQRLDLARAWYWAGYSDRALPLLAGQDDPDAAWLRDHRVAREEHPYVYAGLEHAIDSDRMEAVTLVAGGGWRLGPGTTLDLRARRLSLRDASGSPTGQDLQVLYRWRIGDPAAGTGTWWPAVALRASRLDGDTALGGLARVTWIPHDLWRVDAEWGRERINTPRAVAAGVHADSLSLGADHQATPRWLLAASAASVRFDDGNHRLRLAGRAEYLLLARPRWTAGVEAAGFRSSDPTSAGVPDRGYWNPARYQEARAFTAWRWEHRPWDLAARLGLGISRETDGFGNRSTGHPSQWQLEIGLDVSPGWRASALVAGSGSGLGLGNGGAGYWRRSVGITLIGWL